MQGYRVGWVGRGGSEGRYLSVCVSGRRERFQAGLGLDFPPLVLHGSQRLHVDLLNLFANKPFKMNSNILWQRKQLRSSSYCYLNKQLLIYYSNYVSHT